MKISKWVAAAGLTVAIGALAPSVFAQSGAGGASAGMPATGSAGSITGQAPSAGQPGTQAPASAAPVGSASSDYMSNEGANAPASSSISGPAAQNKETRARWLETKVERDIVAARANGVNVAEAQHHKWLGSTALSKGDRAGAMRHFEIAERDLQRAGSRIGGTNESSTNLHGNETSQNPNAAHMHSITGTNAAY
ncbi:MAG TPA: hypothetical protein VJ728_17235 [Candidatus Binataceae bacterium]|nr:hypothetical protein [Candidatus Binataceae bacterium]